MAAGTERHPHAHGRGTPGIVGCDSLMVRQCHRLRPLNWALFVFKPGEIWWFAARLECLQNAITAHAVVPIFGRPAIPLKFGLLQFQPPAGTCGPKASLRRDCALGPDSR